jgi:ABC-2 type transport system ATP-binding protein
LRLGAELNRGSWDREAAEQFAYGSGPLRPGARIRTLSGGQRARVALALALGKRADLLLLDEPTAELDPLARQELLRRLLAQVAEHGATLVLSSHAVAELEDVCDYLLVLTEGRAGLAGDTEDLLGAHVRLTGTGSGFGPHTVVEQRAAGRGRTALVRPRGRIGDEWAVEQPSLEELVLAHLRHPDTPPLLTADADPATRQETAA